MKLTLARVMPGGVSRGMDGVVPFAVEFIPGDRD
jgi:hypothetical protein